MGTPTSYWLRCARGCERSLCQRNLANARGTWDFGMDILTPDDLANGIDLYTSAWSGLGQATPNEIRIGIVLDQIGPSSS